MKVKCQQVSSAGPVRDHNEDFLTFWEPDDFDLRQKIGSIALLADGVGGESNGDVASRLATETALGIFRDASPESPVRDVVRGRGRSMQEAAMRVFDPKPRDGDMKPPLSREELRARQDRFYAESRLRIAREGAPGGRRLLVYVQCGQNFDAPWLDGPRAYDVLLNSYLDAEPNPRADAVVSQAGTKTTAIRRLLAERPDLLMRYEAALFLDDDIELGAADIDALFAAAARENLDLAQPALTADSETAWPFLKRPDAPNGLFRVSTVEIMAPLMTRRALEAAGWAFSETVGGWGTDLVLGPAVRAAFGPESVGVIGSVAVRHARKVDTAGGAYYAYLRRFGIDPAHEANRVVADFGVERYLRLLAPGEPGPTVRLETLGEPARRALAANSCGDSPPTGDAGN